MSQTTGLPSMNPESLPAVGTPALHTGDRLSIEEFERRYEAMPEVKKAELIEGVVFMGSPVSTEGHGRPHSAIGSWLGLYWFNTPGVEVADNSTLKVRVGTNRPQPDSFLRILPEVGGQSHTDEKGYLVGCPELVGEITHTTVSLDLTIKKEVYRKNGAREYLVWRVEEQAIDWFVLSGGQFEPLAADAAGILKSPTFPGLWLDPGALLKSDFARVQYVLQAGLASPEHQDFVAALHRRRSQPL